MSTVINQNESDYVWTDTINSYSPYGYYVLKGVADAQTFLKEQFVESAEPFWRKAGRFALEALNEGLKNAPFYKHLSK